jgi:quercetin dioxygenase-like cupin family protein
VTTGNHPTLLPLHRGVEAGARFWGPGDMYRFLITGEETGGDYFVMEAVVPPGGGPPLHIHRREAESFFVVEGVCDFHLDGTLVTMGPGGYVNVPRDTVHRFHNSSDALTRLILTFTPDGIEHFFLETLKPVIDGEPQPDETIEEVGARYAEAAPRYGMEFLV